MAPPGWLTGWLADVPPDDRWLTPRELDVLARLRIDKRRRDWRLGRYTAKVALASWLDAPLESIEILAAPDGAPEAWLGGRRAMTSMSLSHRGDRALVVVGDAGAGIGCDLELIEPRSPAFVHDWLAPAEQRLVEEAGASRDLAANLAWTAKEAAAKLRREGLRLDVRKAVTEPGGLELDGEDWRPVSISWTDGGGRSHGWWRVERGWVMAIAGEPAPDPPRALLPRAQP